MFTTKEIQASELKDGQTFYVEGKEYWCTGEQMGEIEAYYEELTALGVIQKKTFFPMNTKVDVK